MLLCCRRPLMIIRAQFCFYGIFYHNCKNATAIDCNNENIISPFPIIFKQFAITDDSFAIIIFDVANVTFKKVAQKYLLKASPGACPKGETSETMGKIV